jgi:hypothetical protein
VPTVPVSYAGRRAVLATKHDKLGLFAPHFRERLGLDVVAAAIDTDLLGTFSGDIPRIGTPLETVREKARRGMAAAGVSLGLASEGSIGPAEGLPFAIVDIELAVFIDDDIGIEVVEVASEFGLPMIRAEIGAGETDTLALDRAGFPEHGLIVRPVGGGPVVKGIHDLNTLRRVVDEFAAMSPERRVHVESDFRAHHHPRRRVVIERAAIRLAERLQSRCPSCRSPGWGVVERRAGAPCDLCAAPTHIDRSEVLGCVRCAFSDERELAAARGIDAQWCQWCNP